MTEGPVLDTGILEDTDLRWKSGQDDSAVDHVEKRPGPELGKVRLVPRAGLVGLLVMHESQTMTVKGSNGRSRHGFHPCDLSLFRWREDDLLVHLLGC